MAVSSGSCLPLEDDEASTSSSCLNNATLLTDIDRPATTGLTDRGGGGEGTSLNVKFSSDIRDTIDHEVHKWVLSQFDKNKILNSNQIRQKAYEIGQRHDQYFKASLNWYKSWKKKINFEEQPELDALRNRKRAYTAAFKLHAVQRSNELLSVSQASLELNVSRRCLQRWKEELDVISTVAETASNAVYRRPGQGRKVGDSALDMKLVEWLQEAWKDGQQVSSSGVRQKAKEISVNPNFKASLGWYMKWQKRHNVNLKDKTIDSPALRPLDSTHLKLRLLPEGQQCAYSDHTVHPRKKRRTIEEQPLSPVEEEGGVGESEAEFDRMLLTWLVERWDSSDTVTERMLREKANEILTTPTSFRPTKSWLMDWMKKYNVSLENQTFGLRGETEGEIVEESPVYDDITVQDSSPLTPTKEEAATALASLASEDPGGLEIAEALQKLASAFGLNQATGKEAVVHQLAALSEQMTSQPSLMSPSPAVSPSNIITPAPLPQETDPAYLLEEGVVQLSSEDVISEEIVTDDNIIVYDDTNTAAINEGDEGGVVRGGANILTTSGTTGSGNIEYEIVGGASGAELLTYPPGNITSFDKEGGDVLTTPPPQHVFVEDGSGDLLATPTGQQGVVNRVGGEEEVTTESVVIDNDDNIINELIATPPTINDVIIMKTDSSFDQN